jgi:hypothetical protein
MNALRRAVTAVAVAAGLVAVTAGPAAAGVILGNHCPPTRRSS